MIAINLDWNPIPLPISITFHTRDATRASRGVSKGKLRGLEHHSRKFLMVKSGKNLPKLGKKL